MLGFNIVVTTPVTDELIKHCEADVLGLAMSDGISKAISRAIRENRIVAANIDGTTIAMTAGVFKCTEGDEDKRSDGLTAEEGRISDHLIEAWNLWIDLPRKHPSEYQEFVSHVHQLQALLALRVLQRDYPAGWPTYDLPAEEPKP